MRRFLLLRQHNEKSLLPSTSHLFLVCCGAWAAGCDVVQHQNKKRTFPGHEELLRHAMKWNFRLTCFFISLSAASSVSTLIPTSTPLIQFARQKLNGIPIWIGFSHYYTSHVTFFVINLSESNSFSIAESSLRHNPSISHLHEKILFGGGKEKNVKIWPFATRFQSWWRNSIWLQIDSPCLKKRFPHTSLVPIEGSSNRWEWVTTFTSINNRGASTTWPRLFSPSLKWKSTEYS